MINVQSEIFVEGRGRILVCKTDESPNELKGRVVMGERGLYQIMQVEHFAGPLRKKMHPVGLIVRPLFTYE